MLAATCYQVYRIIDPNKTDHTGNWEWGRLFETEEEAQLEADRLNGEEKNYELREQANPD